MYWNDSNELVDRLRLLIAEQSAGNKALTNKIHSIIEELREDGYNIFEALIYYKNIYYILKDVDSELLSVTT